MLHASAESTVLRLGFETLVCQFSTLSYPFLQTPDLFTSEILTPTFFQWHNFVQINQQSIITLMIYVSAALFE